MILLIACHCEERSDEAISVEFQVVRDCFAEFILRNEGLAMTYYVAINLGNVLLALSLLKKLQGEFALTFALPKWLPCYLKLSNIVS